MPLIEVLLGFAALWSLCGHIVALVECRKVKSWGQSASGQVRTMALTSVGFILALGFLGLLLK